MLRTFNCGIGLIAVAGEKNAGHVIDAFQEAGDKAVRIGHADRRATAKPKWFIAGR